MNDIISVMVVTFNSENTILDTLDSILKQSIGPGRIDLVISDDCSQDFTFEVTNSWLRMNGKKFYSYKLLTKDKNCGVSANCNSGWKACSGEWIKSIGGDDLLEKDCLQKFLNYVKNDQECSIVFSKMQWFGRINKITPEPFNMPFFDLSAQKQYQYLMFRSFNIAPTSFIKRHILESVGYADEDFRLIEDLPLWLKFTSLGYKLYFLPEVTVKYRVQNSTSKHSTRYINTAFLQELIIIDSAFKLSKLPSIKLKLFKIDTLILLYGKKIITKITRNRVSWLSKFLDIIHFILRPFYFFWKLRRIYVNKKSLFIKK